MSWKLLPAHRTPIRRLTVGLTFFTKDSRYWVAWSTPAEGHILAVRQSHERSDTVPERISLEDVY
jgi:hypothetical protein